MLYQLLPKPPPTGRRLLKDSRILCNISSGSFPKFLLHDFLWLLLIWGNVNASPSVCEKEPMSLFKFLAPRFAAAAAAAAAVRPLACCLPAEQQGCPAPTACLKWGFDAGPGRTRVEREGKCQTRPGESSVLPPKRKPRSCLPSNSKETHSPCLSPGITALHMGRDSSSCFTAPSAACRPAQALAAHGRCTSLGKC